MRKTDINNYSGDRGGSSVSVGSVSFVSCVSAMSNIGPAYGMTGPATTFAAIPDVAKWILSGMMLVGRLEIFTVLLLFTKEYKVTK